MSTNKGKDLASASSKAVAYELPIIQQGDQILVSAKLLHRKLKVKSLFANWIKRRIEEYGFLEGVDYFPNLESKKGRGGHNAKDYLLTLDTAKEMAMVERNAVGRQIRRYFIATEKQLRSTSHLPTQRELTRGLPSVRINGRKLYAYTQGKTRCGYSPRGSSSRHRDKYWMHFVKYDSMLYCTEEFLLHLYYQKHVIQNRPRLLATTPVLPPDFGQQPLPFREGGSHD